MSAEFVFAVANVTKPKDYWLDYISHMDDGHMASFIDETDDQFDWSDRIDHPVSDPYSHDFYQKVAEAIVEAVNVAYDYYYNRELGWRTYKGETLVITGGMTWGDEPTDAFDAVRIFDALQYWDETTYNKEDN